ncbi:MAG: regulatory protein [Saprospiraceae bacterium]|jgi:regulatory protein
MIQKEILHKLMRYCDYQDRCHQEVRTKLLQLKIYGQDLEEVMAELISTDYLNEERFATSYARGKYRIKGWGRIKIRQGLKSKRISDYSIRKGLQEIEKEGGYQDTLLNHLTKYRDQRKNKYDKRLLQQKTYAHGVSKGYESALISEVIQELF